MFQVSDNDKMHVAKDLISFLNIEAIPLGGLNSGVPTRTTATITPTTLRNIETCLEIQCQVESHQNQAGFVPPVVQASSQGIFMSVVDAKSWQGGSTRISPESRHVNGSSLEIDKTPTPRRNGGGRKPNKDLDVSPEEEERRAVRRERNKMAAARCRKRRLDHTNELVEETEELEEKKQGLQAEIQQLQMQKVELEYILETHKPCCRLNQPPGSPPDVKPYVDENGDISTSSSEPECKKPANVILKPSQPVAVVANPLPPTRPPLGANTKRPNTLPFLTGSVSSEIIPITTPTAGMPFNFDSLMEGGTGLTPVSAPLIPSCSTQQRNADLSSPDSNKLVSL